VSLFCERTHHIFLDIYIHATVLRYLYMQVITEYLVYLSRTSEVSMWKPVLLFGVSPVTLPKWITGTG
jgi:hypothetical protein